MAIITSTTASIFSAPPDSILLHACNAKGVWGSGVALEFKKRYPQAFKTYTTHCKSPPPGTTLHAHQQALAGTCLLIPASQKPLEANPTTTTPSSNPSSKPKINIPPRPNHHIACLITSTAYGRAISCPETILANTASALLSLKIRIEEMKVKEGWESEVWAVRINSGRFGVEWERTRGVLEGGGVDVMVVTPVGEDGGGGGGGGGKEVVGGKRKVGSDEVEEERASVKGNLRKRRMKREAENT